MSKNNILTVISFLLFFLISITHSLEEVTNSHGQEYRLLDVVYRSAENRKIFPVLEMVYVGNEWINPVQNATVPFEFIDDGTKIEVNEFKVHSNSQYIYVESVGAKTYEKNPMNCVIPDFTFKGGDIDDLFFSLCTGPCDRKEVSQECGGSCTSKAKLSRIESFSIKNQTIREILLSTSKKYKFGWFVTVIINQDHKDENQQIRFILSY